ncbi:Aste57867_23944 [Aphanomyces stellatus]|uniref:Aste57867_23944 protein n=1 Tax=Aphanomyces stellatus TaxID=120398 RepID=A0A485LP54_9STRA|nr:hypothetical protein As57867_023871 [Aphanomyces stellatus]VFU00587.1 Aste57867_23944 [Aphanomyces stellatus]
MGQVVSDCCGGAPALDVSFKHSRHPEDATSSKTEDEGTKLYSLENFVEYHEQLQPPRQPPVEAIASKREIREGVAMLSKLPDVPEVNEDDIDNAPPLDSDAHVAPNDDDDMHIMEPSLSSGTTTTHKAKLLSMRSRSESDMLSVDTPSSTTSSDWSRSSSARLLNEDEASVDPPVVVSPAKRRPYSVKVQRFTPHLTGSVYDFLVTIGDAKPIRVSHTRNACKKYYAVLKHLHRVAKLPPFPPKAGLGILSPKDECDINSCSFMQDFLDRLLALDAIRFAQDTLEFFGVARPSKRNNNHRRAKDDSLHYV